MAYYRKDWGGDALDAAPAGVTARWNVANTTIAVKANAAAPKGKAVRITRSANNRALYSDDAVSVDADRNKFTARALIQLPASVGDYSSSVPGMHWIGCRASGAAGAETGYAPGLTIATAGNPPRLRWAHYLAGASDVSSFVPNFATFGARYWLVLSVDGSSQTLSVYAETDYTLSTPLATATRTTTTIVADGWIGFGGFSQVAGAGEEWLLWDVVTGASTLPALIPEGTPAIGTITPGSTSIEVAYSTTGVWAGTSYEYRINGGPPAVLGASPATIAGLTENTTYDGPGLEIRAVNAAGSGAWSSPQSFATNAGGTVVKGVSVTLHDGVTPQPNITGITARWWDGATNTGAPVFETTTASTDGSGVLVLDLDAVTALEVGGVGYLVLYKAGADAESDLHFASRLPVQDVA